MNSIVELFGKNWCWDERWFRRGSFYFSNVIGGFHFTHTPRGYSFVDVFLLVAILKFNACM